MSSRKKKLLESAQKNIQKGQLERAIAEYVEIIQLDGDIKHRQRLAELLVKVNRKDDAVREFTQVAKYYIDNTHYVKAIAVYKQIQKLDSSNPEISLTLASLNEKQGLIGNAAAEYAAALEIFESTGSNRKAITVLESILALDSQNSAARYRLAEKHFAIGDEDKALAEFEILAVALKKNGDESGLKRVIDRLKSIFPERSKDLINSLIPQPPPAAPKPPPIQPQAVPKPSIKEEQKPAHSPLPVTQPPAQKPLPVPSEPEPVIPSAQVTPEPLQTREVEIPAAPIEEESQDLELIDEIEELEAIEEIETIEEIEELEELEELETIAEMEVEQEQADETDDWEEEIDLDNLQLGQDEISLIEPEMLETELPEPELEELELELEIEEEQQQIEEQPPEQETPAVETEEPVDLANELSMFADELNFDLLTEGGESGSDAEDSLSAFKKGDLDKEDSESHYSLGLAYKEMGLFDEAIAEFKVAARSPGRKVDCLILQGLCHRDGGDLSKAVMTLYAILQEPEITEDELLSVKYELAACHEISGETDAARRLFTEIVTIRPGFSDAADHLENL